MFPEGNFSKYKFSPLNELLRPLHLTCKTVGKMAFSNSPNAYNNVYITRAFNGTLILLWNQRKHSIMLVRIPPQFGFFYNFISKVLTRSTSMCIQCEPAQAVACPSTHTTPHTYYSGLMTSATASPSHGCYNLVTAI